MTLKEDIIKITVGFLEWYNKEREALVKITPETMFKNMNESVYPYVIYNEHDLRTQLFYEIINKMPNIKRYLFHFEFDLKKGKYHYHPKKMSKQWDDAMDKILKARGKEKGKAGDIDMLIEIDEVEAFYDLCIELKYFHYSVEDISRGQNTPLDQIKERYEMLKILRENGISKDILFIVGDLYYNRTNQNKEMVDYIKSIPNSDMIYLPF